MKIIKPKKEYTKEELQAQVVELEKRVKKLEPTTVEHVGELLKNNRGIGRLA